MSWRVTPSQCGTLRRCRGEMQFLTQAAGLLNAAGSKPPPHLRRHWAPGHCGCTPQRSQHLEPGRAHSRLRPAWNPAPAQSGLGSTSSSKSAPPLSPQNVKTAPSPLISSCMFPTNAGSQAREPAGGRELRGPGGPRAQKLSPQPLLLAFLFNSPPISGGIRRIKAASK